MVQCEMCGTDVANPTTIKVEGAELDVCGDCTDFGTEVRDESSTSSTSTKYSTSSSSGSSSSSSSGGGESSGGRRRDMFDEMEEMAQDYDQRVRNAREAEGLSQENLAGELNEKASLIRKIENGDSLPSDKVRNKLEKRLGISLTEGAGNEDTEWEGGSSSGSYTLGDVVERKD